MVQQNSWQDITKAGVASTRQSVESLAVTQMAHVRTVVRYAPDVVDSVPGCRPDGTCGGCVKFLQSGEGHPTVCARKFRQRVRNPRDNPNHSVSTARSGSDEYLSV